jgi:hypothetical protein
MNDREPDIDQATSERRQAKRFGSAMPLYVDGVKAQLTDLSATGVGFVSEEPFEPGHNVQIGVRHLPDDRHPRPCEAEVVRVTRGERGFRVGARLAQPVAQAKDEGSH